MKKMASNLLSSILHWDHEADDNDDNIKNYHTDGKEGASLVFIDEGYAEVFKWQFGVTAISLLSDTWIVLPWESLMGNTETGNENNSSPLLAKYNPRRIAFFVSSSLLDSLFALNRAISATTGSNAAHVTIVTINSPDACKLEDSTENDETLTDYQFIKSSLQEGNGTTATIEIIHLPLHVVPVLHCNDSNVS
jgi:hypothetical protein